MQISFGINKKLLLAAVLAIGLLFLFRINFSFAQGEVDINTGVTLVNPEEQIKGVGGLIGLAASISSGIVTLIAGLIPYVIDIGREVMQMDIVRVGAQVMISLANLGFVAAIIVIAFATIFRLESYGMKQTLRKLIIAALLVNFSLYIAGGFISFSNIFTDYFLERTTGNSLSNGLAGVLGPQSLAEVNTNDSVWGKIKGFFDLSYWFKYILSVLFILLFTVIIILIFAAVLVMLLIRVVALAILLILMPIVWLLWIFPYTESYWKQWWSSFLRWTFFAPIVIFFIYLVITTGNGINKMTQRIGGEEEINRAFETTNMLRPGFFAHAAQIIIVGGLLFGSLIAANKFSLEGGKEVIGWAEGAGKNMGKNIGKWTERQALRAGTLPLRGKRGRDFVENLQKGEKGIYKAASYVGGKYVGRVLSGAGITQGEKFIREAEDRQKGLSDKQLALQLATFTREGQVAALARLTKNQNLDMVPDLAKYIRNPGTKRLFESYGQGKAYNDMEKTVGFNTAILNAKTPEERTAAFREFRSTYTLRDYDKLQGDIFGDYKKPAYGLSEDEHRLFRSSNENTILEFHPGAISKIRSKLRGDALKHFQETVDSYIVGFENKYLEEGLRGAAGTIKQKLAYIDKKFPEQSNVARGLYNARKNFAGSLLGPSFIPEAEIETT